ncbi:unnamed protein product [Pleuronectes platessa]|uniref:Uncharacterized protein n=1 Tax=Pleuronectes platessa TaxID=8262 RepID=A0A9N7TNB3_PLEPL|nr:unnamed protein product [Pleuronectes platessa]
MPRNYNRKTTWGQTPLAEMESAAAEGPTDRHTGWKGNLKTFLRPLAIKGIKTRFIERRNIHDTAHMRMDTTSLLVWTSEPLKTIGFIVHHHKVSVS